MIRPRLPANVKESVGRSSDVESIKRIAPGAGVAALDLASLNTREAYSIRDDGDAWVTFMTTFRLEVLCRAVQKNRIIFGSKRLTFELSHLHSHRPEPA